jgi:predicted DNA-binding transcriptional regulator AlpA
MITWIKAQRVAELCGVTLMTVYQWKKRDMGPPYYQLPNRGLRWVEDEVEEWLKTKRVIPQKNHQRSVSIN